MKAGVRVSEQDSEDVQEYEQARELARVCECE